MLHVSYKPEEKVWRKTKESIGRIKEKKEQIFKEIKKELGLIVVVAKSWRIWNNERHKLHKV